MASQLSITVNTNNGGTVTTKTVVLALPKNLTDGSQPGLDGPDVSIRNIFKAGGFWDAAHQNFYPACNIQQITWS